MPAKPPRSSSPATEPAAQAGDKPKRTTKARAPSAANMVALAVPRDPEARSAATADDADDADDGDGDVGDEVLAPAAEALGDVAESTEDDEAEPIDDEDRPRKRLAIAYADDPDRKQVALSHYDPMQAYLHEVQRHALLTPDEEHDLATKYFTTGDVRSAHRLVTANLRLVVKIAYEYRRAYKNIMDLVQEGNVGLMQAVKKFDPGRGVKLSSYAAWWIRAYILRFILNNWRLVKLGTTQAQRKLFFNLRKKRAELVAMGIEPSDAEVAKALDVPENDVREMEVRLSSSEKSLDAPVGDAEGRSIARVDMVPSMSEGPESLMAGGELQALLKARLADFRKTLAGKDIAIFDERLVADDPLTLQQLGDRFGISRERVRQLEQRLTGRLREFLREELGDAAMLT